MDGSITKVLYEWLLKRRIISDVAAEMGLDGSTLAAKLRPKATQARLTADELIPLCQAIRKAGAQYSKELDGILHRFTRDLFGAEPVKADPTVLLSSVFELSKGMGELLSNTEQIAKSNDPDVIRRLQTLVSSEDPTGGGALRSPPGPALEETVQTAPVT